MVSYKRLSGERRLGFSARDLRKVENAFARLGMRRLSRCFEQTALGAQTWLEVACAAYLCGRLRVEPSSRCDATRDGVRRDGSVRQSASFAGVDFAVDGSRPPPVS
jgi:hypothetical protein